MESKKEQVKLNEDNSGHLEILIKCQIIMVQESIERSKKHTDELIRLLEKQEQLNKDEE